MNGGGGTKDVSKTYATKVSGAPQGCRAYILGNRDTISLVPVSAQGIRTW